VTGNAALAGALNIAYYGSYSSSNAGDTFPLFTFGSSSGAFNTTTVPSADYAMAYTALNGTLNFTASALNNQTTINQIASAQAYSSNSLVSLLSDSTSILDSMYATDLVIADGTVQLLSANNASVEQCK
jgi:hypothetical protein